MMDDVEDRNEEDERIRMMDDVEDRDEEDHG